MTEESPNPTSVNQSQQPAQQVESAEVSAQAQAPGEQEAKKGISKGAKIGIGVGAGCFGLIVIAIIVLIVLAIKSGEDIFSGDEWYEKNYSNWYEEKYEEDYDDWYSDENGEDASDDEIIIELDGTKDTRSEVFALEGGRQVLHYDFEGTEYMQAISIYVVEEGEKVDYDDDIADANVLGLGNSKTTSEVILDKPAGEYYIDTYGGKGNWFVIITEER